jgi:hypothetical protein
VWEHSVQGCESAFLSEGARGLFCLRVLRGEFCPGGVRAVYSVGGFEEDILSGDGRRVYSVRACGGTLSQSVRGVFCPWV